MKLRAYLFLLLATFSLTGQEVIIRSPSGEPIVIEVNKHDNFLDTIELLKSHFGTENEYILDFNPFSSVAKKSGSTTTPFRDYLAPITSSQRSDIKYILTSLGLGSLIKIAKETSSLRKAGKRVEYVHPLRFLTVVFTDEEMKASMHGLYGRTWVWDEFFGGLRDSFDCETDRNNMKPEFISDFAATVGINPDLIYPSINSRQWNQMIGILVDNIPRKTDARRYGQ